MDWSMLIPVIVGGAISLISSILVITIGLWIDHRRRVAERMRLGATNANVGLHKLMATLNSIENMARHIDREFKAISAEINPAEDPSMIVRPIVGAFPVLDDLSATEMEFLSSGDGSLPAKIWEIQLRARNSEVILSEYNKLKADYHRFVEEIEGGIQGIEGDVVHLQFEGQDAKIATIKIGQMNLLLADLIQALEEDRQAIKIVVKDYLDAANGEYGEYFPIKRLELL